jgi:hypothetical protein
MGTEAFAAPGQFYRGNVHTHSTRSDGRLDPPEVCRRYREAGYDFLCLSDHFLPKYGFPITDTVPFRTNSFTTILGAEIHAPANSHGEAWHILAAGLPEDFTPTGANETGVALAACQCRGCLRWHRPSTMVGPHHRGRPRHSRRRPRRGNL